MTPEGRHKMSRTRAEYDVCEMAEEGIERERFRHRVNSSTLMKIIL